MFIKRSIPKDEVVTRLVERFELLYTLDLAEPLYLVRVPLRVAPLGAHSDHQGGTVTGLTINRFVYLLCQPRARRVARVFSLDFNASHEVEFDNISEARAGEWGNYLRGAVAALSAAGHELRAGFDAVLLGEMPIGGLSSSAAVTIGYIQALALANNLSPTPIEVIKLVREVENGYLGLHNGILDQSVIIGGRVNHLTVVDCAREELDWRQVGANVPDWGVLVVYSGLSRSLIGTPFNQRVAECVSAARELCALEGITARPNVRLGDLSVEVFERRRGELSEVSRKRAQHFFSEAERVRRGLLAWEGGDIEAFGGLVSQSGESSIVNYESGGPELRSLYELLASAPGVYGARFCGGGFRGCCLALIRPDQFDSISERVYRSYVNLYPELKEECSFHLCGSSGSVSVEVIK
ncbi:MAG: galactokinase family protein [Pseudomonadota bacterium]